MEKVNAKKVMSCIAITTLLCYNSQVSIAQTANETVQELSKVAKKGVLDNSKIDENSLVRITYQMKVEKKSDQLSYEDYVFDKNLVFKGIQPTVENKTSKPDQKVTTLSAFVGGTNSFNVLSMSLNLQSEVWERIWDYKKQKYQWGKRLSKENVKPKNNDSKYIGFAAYSNDDDGSVAVIASYEKAKDNEDQFVALYITNDLSLKETALPLTGNYSLVYCDVLQSNNIYAIFAPNKGMSDTKKYVYIEFTPKAEIVIKKEFTAPSSNMLIMDAKEINGSVYFCAGSDKSSDAYNQVFSHYAPIDNPGYSTSKNKLMDKYERKVYGTEFYNFHLLKITNGEVMLASTVPVSSFKQKIVTPQGQKKASPYEGKKIAIQNITVTPTGECLVTGQLEDKKIINNGTTISWRYYDFVCLHFDNTGNLKAQYAVEKMNDDSKSEMFQSKQNFFLSADGKSMYWELMEVKGTKGYASFLDAYNGNTTFIANYFPRIAKIDLEKTTLSAFTVLGEKGKYLVYKNQSFLFDEKTKTRYYIGHDEDYEKLWLAKYTFE